MAIKLLPRYQQNLDLNGLSPEQFLAVAYQAALQLGWSISYLASDGFIAYTKFSMSSYSEEVKLTIAENSAEIKSRCTGSQMVDWGKNRKNIEGFTILFTDLQYTFSKEELNEKYEALKGEFTGEGVRTINSTSATAKDKIGGVLSMFKPVDGYFITPVLINLNILIFILMAVSGVSVISPDSESLIAWGANFRPATLDGQWWRLLTCCFLHIGIVHLLMNMYALLYIGILLEPLLGKIRFAAAYLLTGIAASATSLVWHDFTVSAGASGAIFGMYGVFLAMLTTNFIEKSARQTLLASIGIFVVYNLMNGMRGGIDNAAHIGGLVSGLIIGYAFYPSLVKPNQKNIKHGIIAMLAILILAGVFVVSQNISNDYVEYDKRMKRFGELESRALEIYQMPDNTPNDQMLSAIKSKGIESWNETLKLLAEIDHLDLPDDLKKRNKALKTYSELRLQSFRYHYKALNENTDRYNDSIKVCVTRLEAVLEQLKENKY